MSNDPRINSLLDQANQLFLKKKFRESISFYDEILKTEPKHLSVLNNKGYALSKSGNYEDAIRCYDEALQIAPDDISVQINKISALRKLKHLENALENCDKLLSKNPDYNVILYHKERILYSLKSFSESIECCNKILLDYPHNSDVLFDKSCCLALLGKKDLCLETLKQAISSQSNLKIKARNNKAFASFLNDDEFIKILE